MIHRQRLAALTLTVVLLLLALRVDAQRRPKPIPFDASHRSASTAPALYRTYSIDGSGNRPDGRGAGHRPTFRRFPAFYPEGTNNGHNFVVNTTSGGLPDCCSLEPFFRTPQDVPNLDGASLLMMSFGQFFAHDMSMSFESPYDEDLQPQSCTSTFRRFEHMPGVSPRVFINNISSFVDMSMVYGADPQTNARLRSYEGGRMLMAAGDLPPRGTIRLGIPMLNTGGSQTTDNLYCIGDIRANENVLLTGLHVVFLREHNRMADELAARNPSWDDERLFQKTRVLNIAQFQNMVMHEFAPGLMGRAVFDATVPRYTGYDAAKIPETFIEFSQALMRMQHAQITDLVPQVTGPGLAITYRNLREFFFAPNNIAAVGIEPFLLGAINHPAQDVTGLYASTLLNLPRLAALDCLRVRDAGLPTMNYVRRAYGITGPITRVPRKQALLDQFDPERIDIWVGGFLEDRPVGSVVGPTFLRMFAEQLIAVRDGDPFWFENPQYEALTDDERAWARAQTIAAVFRRNLVSLEGVAIQDHVLFMPATQRSAVDAAANEAATAAAAAAAASASGAAADAGAKWMAAAVGLLVIALVFNSGILAQLLLVWSRARNE